MSSATPIVLGNPKFLVIDINVQAIGIALQRYVARGSKLTGVSMSDIKTSCTKEFEPTAAPTVTDLTSAGMKLFDAMAWLSFPSTDRDKIIIDDTMTEDSITSPDDIARAVFYCYFFLLTQARYPVKNEKSAAPNVANFLKSIMQMDRDQGYYVDLLCSFEPNKFDPKWIKHVKFEGLGQEAVTRFGLGVAGYRMFGPFKYLVPKGKAAKDHEDAIAFATAVAKAPASWNIHPITRDPSVLKKRGNLNKNLGNLILKVFTDEQIESMVKSKVLYGRPVEQPTAMDYMTWGPDDDVTGTDLIA